MDGPPYRSTWMSNTWQSCIMTACLFKWLIAQADGAANDFYLYKQVFIYIIGTGLTNTWERLRDADQTTTKRFVVIAVNRHRWTHSAARAVRPHRFVSVIGLHSVLVWSGQVGYCRYVARSQICPHCFPVQSQSLRHNLLMTLRCKCSNTVTVDTAD